MATTRMASPAVFEKNSWRRCVATKTENKVTGVMMSNKVKGRDQASGPNINLPPNKNFCKRGIERGADDDTIWFYLKCMSMRWRVKHKANDKQEVKSIFIKLKVIRELKAIKGVKP